MKCNYLQEAGWKAPVKPTNPGATVVARKDPRFIALCKADSTQVTSIISIKLPMYRPAQVCFYRRTHIFLTTIVSMFGKHPYPISTVIFGLCGNEGRTVGKPSEYTVDLPTCVPIL
jgi:hypothetical protein